MVILITESPLCVGSFLLKGGGEAERSVMIEECLAAFTELPRSDTARLFESCSKATDLSEGKLLRDL